MSNFKTTSMAPVLLSLLGVVACGSMLAAPDASALPEVNMVALTDGEFACHANEPVTSESAPLVAPQPPRPEPPQWTKLFDGESLDGWKSTEFGGEGEVKVEDGALVLGFGSNMTGVTSTSEIPRTNYEVEFLGQRVDGSDFFCGLTFPVGEDYLSLILGGWGGGVCGLSSIDGFDASENQTTQYRQFKKGVWYRVKLRVTDDEIVVWLDGERIIEQELEEHKLSIRIEVELSCPFGFASWQTTGAIKDLRIRPLNPSELPAKE